MEIFKESKIAGIKLKNRIIRSATHEGFADTGGKPLGQLEDLYLKLAKGGAGAIITGFTGVQQNGKGASNMRLIDKDEYIDDYKKLNDKLKKTGVPVIMQLVHCGANSNRSISGEDTVAPSEFKNKLYRSTAKELDEDGIETVISSFVKAIIRSKKSGFAGVQLHAAHGYLLSQFLSSYVNKRKDRWGGSLENRFRIIGEIISRAREHVGAYPIFAKISAYDADRKGVRIDEGIRIAGLFQAAGIDCIEVSCGGIGDGVIAVRTDKVPVEALLNFLPGMRNLPPLKKKIYEKLIPLLYKKHSPVFNYNVSAAEAIKKNVDVPVIAVGGIRNLKDIQSVLDQGKADYIAMSRPFIIEPDIVNKFSEGRQTESKCINCGYCLFGVMGNTLRCYKGRIKKQ